MVELMVLFAHLTGVCIALGMIVSTDLRMLSTLGRHQAVVPSPSSFDRHLVAFALLLLYISGTALTWLRLESNPAYLANPKFQAKLILVALLTVNAFVLHGAIFPILERRQRLSSWRSSTRWRVSLVVGLSNSLWFYSAFLGIARVWNNTRSLGFVLSVALLCWVVVALVIRLVLALSSRRAPAAPSTLDPRSTL